MNSRKNEKGFTLIESILIIIILGILAAVAIPKHLDVRQNAANATAQTILASMRSANSILWADRVNHNQTTTYNFVDIIGSMDMKGYNVSTAVDGGGTLLTLTVGSSSYHYSLGIDGLQTFASLPGTYVQIYDYAGSNNTNNNQGQNNNSQH